jgi:CHAT domain-containing protein
VDDRGPAAPLDRAARKYHELLRREQRPAPKEMTAAGREVAAMVLDPLRARLRAKRVVIIADGSLLYVPFAALPIDDRPLLTRYELVSLPSASVLGALRRQERRNATQLAVFADAVFSADDPRLEGHSVTAASKVPETRYMRGATLERLQFSRVEAEAIASAAGERRVLEALDFDAAKQTLLAKDLRRFGILHFATHGAINTERPELSGLVLSLFDARGRNVDGFLRLHEIYNLDLDAGLVVLSACETALGKEVHGEGLVGLIRGFLYAGSRSVMASLWKVEDRATAVLMSRFYQAMLSDGLAPAAALRKAQLSMLAENRWRDPRDWAAFALLGDWR